MSLMCLKYVKKNQQGSSLVVAVFLLLVFGILSMGITQTISSSIDQNTNEIIGTRAFLAAEAGNEVVLQQLFPLDSAPSACISQQQLYFNVDGLQNCNVLARCQAFVESGVTYYEIVSTGVCKQSMQGSNTSKVSADYNCLAYEFCVSRTLEVEAKTNE